MALQKCHECGNAVSTEAASCPKCGAKVRKKTSPVLLAVSAVIVIMIVISIMRGSPSSKPEPPPIKAAATSAPPAAVAPPAPPPPPPPPATVIANAEALLKRSRAGDAVGKALLDGKQAPLPSGPLITKAEWANSREQLGAITRNDAAYPKAQTLLKAMADQDKKTEVFMAALEAKGKIQARKDFAENLERVLIDKRMNVDVTALGPQNTTLKIKYVLANKVIANDLHKSGIVEKAQEAGFKSVLLTDGYDSTWTWKLTP